MSSQQGRGTLWKAHALCYDEYKTKRLEESVEKIRELPEADQDEAAAILLSVAAGNTEPIRLDDDTRDAISDARRSEFVSDDDMFVLFKQHGGRRR